MIHAEYLARIRRRLTLARYPLWAFVILLTVRFWHLQIVRGEEFSILARDNYLQTERRRAPRGLVVDRSGEVLARSEPSFTLLADSAGLRHLEDLGLLEVEDEDRAGLEARAARGPAVVRSGIPFAEAAFFEARRRELPGVRVEFVPARDYPLGQATAHLLGYVGEVTAAQLLLEEFVTAASGDLVGQDGIERVYNTILLGSDGYLDRVVDSRQRVSWSPAGCEGRNRYGAKHCSSTSSAASRRRLTARSENTAEPSWPSTCGPARSSAWAAIRRRIPRIFAATPEGSGKCSPTPRLRCSTGRCRAATRPVRPSSWLPRPRGWPRGWWGPKPASPATAGPGWPAGPSTATARRVTAP